MKPVLSDADLRALYSVAADWHSGQSSRGYRLLSRVYRLMVKRGIQVWDVPSNAKDRSYSRWADAVSNCRGF